ncbi:hypothetical protein ACFW2Y_29750, partial [Streptomyces sp. NPDC058877]|uniref:hypothetical protein n=1 Tax=Streptomyces sp. NPDC058877 TaxID=3346665 RepID=UPI0036B58D8F
LRVPGRSRLVQTASDSGVASPRLRSRRSRSDERAVLLGSDTTPLRWRHTWRVIQTSTTLQVATTVEATAVMVIGKASHAPATVQRKATTAWMSVTEVSITARTAALRTGSGIRRRPRSSSTHN